MMTVMKRELFICVLIGAALVTAAAAAAFFNMDRASAPEAMHTAEETPPASGPVRTAEEISLSPGTVVYSSPNAPDLTPQFQYKGSIYCLRYDALVLESLSDPWSCVGVLNEFVFHSSDFSADFQTNRDDHVNCSIYASPEDKGRLYLELGSGYHPFVLEELTYPWVCCGGTLYLYEDIYRLNFASSLTDGETVLLPENALYLGLCAVSYKYQFPSRELSSNDVSLFNKNMYYDADSDIIYAEIPNGVVNGRTRYDRYYPVPDDFCSDFR